MHLHLWQQHWFQVYLYHLFSNNTINAIANYCCWIHKCMRWQRVKCTCAYFPKVKSKFSDTINNMVKLVIKRLLKIFVKVTLHESVSTFGVCVWYLKLPRYAKYSLAYQPVEQLYGYCHKVIVKNQHPSLSTPNIYGS